MRIPHVGGPSPSFGTRGPDRPSPLNPDTRGLTAALEGTADAAARVANTVENAANQYQQENQMMARAKASNALLDDELQKQGVTEDVQERLRSGDLKWQDAEGEAQRQLDQFKAPEVDGLAPVDAVHVEGGLQRNNMQSLQQVKRLAAGVRREEFVAQTDKNFDTLGKLAGVPDADIEKINAQAEAFQPMAMAAGMSPAAFGAKLQTFKDKNWANQAIGRSIAARDSVDGLTALEHDLSADDGYYNGKLDTDRRQTILTGVATRKASLLAKIESTVDKREALGERALTKMQAQVSSGVPAPLATRLEWLDQVKGTKAEPEFREMEEGERRVQVVLTAPPADQRAYVQQLQAEQQKTGATLTQQANLKRMETAVTENLKQLKDEPLLFHAARTGESIEPLDMQALASGDTAAVQAQIGERMVILGAMQRKYGGEAGKAPLLPQEATAVAGALKQANPKMAAKLFGTLHAAFGDPDAYRAAMQQVAPDSPVRAMAGQIYANQRAGQSPYSAVTAASVNGRFGDVSATLVRGEALLNPSKADKAEDGKGPAFPMPPPKELGDEIASRVGTAFTNRPDEYQTAAQAVRAYYAAKASDEGDVSGVIDTKRLNDSIEAVIGDQASVNGKDVMPPWGMSADTFEDAADESIAARLKAAGIEDPGNLNLINIAGAPGLYGLTRGIQPIVDKRGFPLSIRIGIKR